MVFQCNQIETSKGLLTMLGGGLYDDGSHTDVNLLGRVRASKMQRADKEKIETDSKRFKKDFAYIQKHLCNEDINMQLFHASLPSLSPKREESICALKNMFDNPAYFYVVYWCGHGEPDTGNWCFSQNKSITLKDLLDLWLQSIGYRNEKFLILIADTCHSGCWIDTFQQLQQSSNKYQHIHLMLQCACSKEEEAFIDIVSDKLETLSEFKRPASLLMKKLLFDIVHKKSLKESSQFCWAYSKQHPMYTYQIGLPLKIKSWVKIEEYNIVETGEKYAQIRQIPLLFYQQSNQVWKIIKDGTEAIYYPPEINSKLIIRSGKFLSDF